MENARKNDGSFSIANREDNGISSRTTDRVSNRHDSHIIMIAAIRNDIHNSGVESREDIHTFACPSVAHVSACRISVASVSIKYANGHPTVCRAIRTSSATVRNFSYMDVRDRIDMQEIESRESLTTIVVGHLQLEDEVARTNRIDTGLFCIFIGERNFTTIHFRPFIGVRQVRTYESIRMDESGVKYEVSRSNALTNGRQDGRITRNPHRIRKVEVNHESAV